jgi:lysozyme family protein
MASNRLTWDQVRAPDFEGVLDGFIASSNLIGNAMKTAQGGLDRIKGAQTENADNAVMSKLLRYQGNPDALTADLGSGAFQSDVDMSKISAGMREHLSKAPTELLQFASDKSVYDQEQLRVGDMKFLRDNNPLVNDYNRLLDENKREEAAALLEANPEFRDKANFGLMAGLRESAARRFSTNVNNDTRQFDHTTDVRDDTLTQDVKKIDGIVGKYVLPGDAAGAIRWINSKPKELEGFSVEAINSYMARARGDFSGGAGGGSGGGAGGGVGGAVGGTGSSSFDGSFESAIGSLIEREGGYVAKDGRSGAPANFGINQKANPDIDVKNLTRPQAEQLYRDRYWKPIEAAGIPAAAREAVFDFGVNAGVGRSLEFWKQSGGDINKFNELRLAHYRRQPDYEQNKKSWEGRVAATTGGLASPRDTQVMAEAGTAFNLAFDPQTVQARDALAATQDGRGALEIAQELTSDKGPFKGEDASALADLIYNTATDAKVSPAAVVWALKQHSVGAGKFDIDKWMDDRGGKLFQWLFTDSLKGSKNEEGFKKSLDFVKNRGALIEKVRAADEMQRNAAALGQANAAATAAQKTIDDRNAMARLLGMSNIDNAPYEEQAAKARGLQQLAGRAAAQSTLAGDTSVKDEPPVPDGLTNTATVNLAAVPKEVSKALAINRLRGEVKERQVASFKRSYGYTPDEVINNPQLVSRGAEDAISPRQALRNQAQMAIAGGAATIAAFTRDNGIDPRQFLQN